MLRGSKPPNFGGMNRRFQAKRVVVVGSHCDVISCNLALERTVISQNDNLYSSKGLLLSTTATITQMGVIQQAYAPILV